MSIGEIGKSFNSVFKERLTSPLYGSFVLSWIIWNWKIPYLTFFVSQDSIKPYTKIDYILNNYTNWYHLLLLPFLSAIILVALVPWLANKAYLISLHYERERIKAKESHDSNRRLTIDQSARIRNELQEQKEIHQKQVDSKDNDIRLSREQIGILTQEKIKLQEDLNTVTRETNALKILYAQYGKNETFVDVTQIVSILVTTRKNFIINNQELLGDPLQGVHKELFIVYSVDGSTFKLVVREYYQIDVMDKKLVVNETEESRVAYQTDLKQEHGKDEYFQDH